MTSVKREDAENSYKCRMALKMAIPVVSMDYVDMCVNEGGLVDRDLYLVAGSTKAQQLAQGKIQGRYYKSIIFLHRLS